MLRTCDSHGDCLVVYDTKDCPVCDIVSDHEKQIEAKDDEIQNKDDQIELKDERITELENEVSDLKQE